MAHRPDRVPLSNAVQPTAERAASTTPAKSIIVVCGRCGTRNRVPTDRPGNALCGNCGEALDEASQVSQGPPARPARRVPRLLVLDWWVGAAVLLLAVGAIWSYKPSGGGDAEGSAVSPVPSVPLCAQRLGNGQILRRTAVSSDQGHTLEIRKGSGGDAIVKLKDSATGRTVLSFFVGDAATASEDRIPDGSYEVQFAFGKYVDQTCTNFVGDHRASQFPGEERLVTQDTETERITDHLIYTLYAVASGNVNAKSIDPSVFDAD